MNRIAKFLKADDAIAVTEYALLIALAPEIDPRYERLYAYLQDDVTRKRPSIDLTLNLLPATSPKPSPISKPPPPPSPPSRTCSAPTRCSSSTPSAPAAPSPAKLLP